MQHLKCEFCSSRIGPILPQDMGEDRVMHLCGQCRRYIREGIAGEQAYMQVVHVQLDGKEIAKSILPTIRNSTGSRNF